MLTLLITPQAEQDIDQIITYLLEVNAPAAAKFVAELRDTFSLLSDNPLLGVKRHYRSPALANIRMFPLRKFSTYLVFYMNTDVSLEVVRVLHGSRDLTVLFDGDDE